MHDDILTVLTTTPPAFSEVDAARLAAEHFGIRATGRPLVSERDQNFFLQANDGCRYTLKISNPAEQLTVIDFQCRALIHVALKDSAIPLPRVIPSLDGALQTAVNHAGKTHFVRLLSWLEGTVLDDVYPGPELAHKLGRMLARLGLALEDFDHPGSNPPLLWDIKRAGSLRRLLEYVENPELSELIGKTLDRFDTRVYPILDTLRTQVIYNDLNSANVLLDKNDLQRISGIIDFGDLVKSPLIIDLAVAAAYQLAEGGDPLASALPMIAGYHAERPLLRMEMEILTDLIRTRLVSTLLINSRRTALFPENREYLMGDYDSAINALIGLDQLPEKEAFNRIATACGVETSVP